MFHVASSGMWSPRYLNEETCSTCSPLIVCGVIGSCIFFLKYIIISLVFVVLSSSLLTADHSVMLFTSCLFDVSSLFLIGPVTAVSSVNLIIAVTRYFLLCCIRAER